MIYKKKDQFSAASKILINLQGKKYHYTTEKEP